MGFIFFIFPSGWRKVNPKPNPKLRSGRQNFDSIFRPRVPYSISGAQEAEGNDRVQPVQPHSPMRLERERGGGGLPWAFGQVVHSTTSFMQNNCIYYYESSLTDGNKCLEEVSFLFLFEDREFSMVLILSPRRYLAMFGDIFACHKWVVCDWHLVGRDQGC